jgi:hypothetical protein
MGPQLELKLENVKPHANRTRDIILEIIRNSDWWMPWEICSLLRFNHDILISDSNCTARLREMRRPEFGGHNIVSRPRAGSSAWEYACHD